MVGEWYLAPSRLRVVLLVGSAVAVVWAFWLLEPRQPWQWLLVGGLIALYLYDNFGRRRSQVRGFSLRDGQWYVFIEGKAIAAEPVWVHFATRRLGVIRFLTPAGDRYPVALLPDSLSDEEFRQLAVALR